MLLSEVCASVRAPAPCSFSGLMEMYECNYIFLRRLCADFNKIDGDRVSIVSGGMDLYMKTLQRDKYTTTILLTHYFTTSCLSNEPGNFPNIRVRIYHDARQAEVLSVCAQKKRYMLKGLESNKVELYARWTVNRFLFKWLDYCLGLNHKFA